MHSLFVTSKTLERKKCHHVIIQWWKLNYSMTLEFFFCWKTTFRYSNSISLSSSVWAIKQRGKKSSKLNTAFTTDEYLIDSMKKKCRLSLVLYVCVNVCFFVIQRHATAFPEKKQWRLRFFVIDWKKVNN